MKQILFGLTMLLLIPLTGYSQNTIQLNQYQIQCILKDKSRLNYLEKVTYNDAVLIQELESKVIIHQQLEEELVVLLDNKEKEVNKLKIKNKLILFSSGILAGGLIYLYITK